MNALAPLVIIVLPVFLVVGAGYAAVRTKVFPDAGLDHLVRFATNIAVPVLLFRAMYTLDLGAALRLDHLVSFYGTATLVFFLTIFLSRRFWRRRPGEAVAVGFCALFSNSVLLGLPIMGRAYGEGSLESVFALVALNAPYCYLLGILTMEMLRRDGASVGVAVARTARAMFQNALTLGIAAGVALNLSGITLPEPLMAAVSLLSQAALPVALFGLGGVLTRYSMRAEIGEAAMVSAVSLLLHPLLAWGYAAELSEMPVGFLQSAVVIAAMPTGINGYVFASMYGRAVGTAASVVILSTALSVLTIAFWLSVLGAGGLS
ncbi:MAG: AEC family transporter [Pseudomonadota bacterium]